MALMFSPGLLNMSSRFNRVQWPSGVLAGIERKSGDIPSRLRQLHSLGWGRRSKALELHAGQKDAEWWPPVAAEVAWGRWRRCCRAQNANNCLNGNFREAVAANWPVRERCRAMCGLSSAYFYSTRRTAVLNDWRNGWRVAGTVRGCRVCCRPSIRVPCEFTSDLVKWVTVASARRTSAARIKDANQDRLKRVPPLMSSHEIYENLHAFFSFSFSPRCRTMSFWTSLVIHATQTYPFWYFHWYGMNCLMQKQRVSRSLGLIRLTPRFESLTFVPFYARVL